MTTRLLLSVISLCFAAPVFAYIDPGSGSAIMSAVVGFFVAVGLAVKTYWYKLKGMFTRKNVAPAVTEEVAEDESAG